VSNNIEPREERSLLIYFSQINDLPIMYQVVYSIPSAQDSQWLTYNVSSRLLHS